MFSIEAYEERKKKYIFCYLIYTSLFIVKVNSMFIITIVLKYIKKKKKHWTFLCTYIENMNE